MKKKGAISITAKQGSYIVGTVSFIGSILAPIPLSMFGRKTLLIWGQVVMGISLLFVGYFQLMEYTIPLILGICVFIIAFQFTQGPIAWMYAAEVAVDTALGICILALFLSLLEKAITMEFMVHSSLIGPHGMFFILGVITIIGAVFMKVYVKETKGLSDKEKKQLYMPIDLQEESSEIKQEQKIDMNVTVVPGETDIKKKEQIKPETEMTAQETALNANEMSV